MENRTVSYTATQVQLATSTLSNVTALLLPYLSDLSAAGPFQPTAVWSSSTLTLTGAIFGLTCVSLSLSETGNGCIDIPRGAGAA